MASRFQEKFKGNVQVLKDFAKGLREYNNQLELVYLAMIEEIQTRSLGKDINNVFAKRVATAIGDKIKCVISAGYAEYSCSGEKVVKVLLTDEKYSHTNHDYRKSVTCEINFGHGNQYEKAGATKDNKFIEDSIQTIVNIINHNRKNVADYEDAASKAEKQVKKINKAINTFLRTMEEVNPMFVDSNATIELSYGGNKGDVKAYDYQAYDKERYAKADLLELATIKKQ